MNIMNVDGNSFLSILRIFFFFVKVAKYHGNKLRSQVSKNYLLLYIS